MLPGQTLTRIVAFAVAVQRFRLAFRRGSTFALFALLATGLAARTTRRTVAGMLAGAGMAAAVSFHSACRFLLPPRLGRRPDRAGAGPADRRSAAARSGRRSRWWSTTPCSAAGGPRCTPRYSDPRRLRPGPQRAGPRQPVGDRGHRRHAAVLYPPRCACRCCCGCGCGKGTASPVQLAGEMISLLAQAFPDRRFYGSRGRRLLRQGPLLVSSTPRSPPGCRSTPRSTRPPRRTPADAADPGSRGTGSATPPTSPQTPTGDRSP